MGVVVRARRSRSAPAHRRAPAKEHGQEPRRARRFSTLRGDALFLRSRGRLLPADGGEGTVVSGPRRRRDPAARDTGRLEALDVRRHRAPRRGDRQALEPEHRPEKERGRARRPRLRAAGRRILDRECVCRRGYPANASGSRSGRTSRPAGCPTRGSTTPRGTRSGQAPGDERVSCGHTVPTWYPIGL